MTRAGDAQRRRWGDQCVEGNESSINQSSSCRGWVSIGVIPRTIYHHPPGTGLIVSSLTDAEVAGHPKAPTGLSSSPSSFEEIPVAAMDDSADSTRSNVRLMPAMSREVMKGPTNTRSTITCTHGGGTGPMVSECKGKTRLGNSSPCTLQRLRWL